MLFSECFGVKYTIKNSGQITNILFIHVFGKVRLKCVFICNNNDIL